MAQENIFQRFKKVPLPEKIWVFTHPFVAKKAWQITAEVQQKMLEIKNDSRLDGNENGGQVDAFRHAFWLASLAQKLDKQKARSLGKAHEKGNYSNFKNKTLEEGSLPDATACEMDLKNNEVGIEIGSTNKNASPEQLAEIIIDFIKDGKLWVVRKTSDGRFLNIDNQIISEEEYIGKWKNPKCLVPSNFSLFDAR